MCHLTTTTRDVTVSEFEGLCKVARTATVMGESRKVRAVRRYANGRGHGGLRRHCLLERAVEECVPVLKKIG
jgi:hypothetical protein